MMDIIMLLVLAGCIGLVTLLVYWCQKGGKRTWLFLQLLYYCWGVTWYMRWYILKNFRPGGRRSSCYRLY